MFYYATDYRSCISTSMRGNKNGMAEKSLQQKLETVAKAD